MEKQTSDGYIEYVAGGGAVAGNTLNVKGSGMIVGAIARFGTLNFFLPESLRADDTVLTAQRANLTCGANGSCAVNVGIDGNSSLLRVGDAVTLIDASEGTLTTGGDLNRTTTGELRGATLQYRFDIVVQGKKLKAIVRDICPG